MPPRDQTPPTPLNPPPESYDLATPEEVATRRRRQRWLVGGIAALALLGLSVAGAHSVTGAIKGWQARRSAAEALRLLGAGQSEQGVGKLQDALALRGTDPEVERMAAVFLTRTGHGREALGFWKQVEEARPLTRDEQRDYAADLLAGGDPAGAKQRLRLAWPEGAEGSPADWDVGMRIGSAGQDPATAIALAKRLVDPKAAGVTARQRLDAALTLLGGGDPADRELGGRTLHTVADGGASLESLEALLLLARQSAQEITAERAQKLPVPEAEAQKLLGLAARIDVHPQAKTAQRLTAVQARMVAQPDERARLIQGAVDRYGQTGNNDDLATLAAWLYAQGEFQKVLEVITPQRATASRGLYLQFLDALGATGQWAEIRRTLESQRFSLDPMIEQMYLARCATQLGQPEVAKLRWNDALRAAGNDPEKLLSLGRYAQVDGAPGTAEAAFRAAMKAVPNNRAVYGALLALFQVQGRTADARQVLRAMLDVFPEESAARNDYAYLGALLGQDLTADRDTARELVSAEPNSLPHRVALALAELRLGHGLTALEPLKPVPPAVIMSQPRFAAVDAAVLWETGFYDDARKIAAAAAQQGLLPEERQLIQPIKETEGKGEGPK